MTLPETGVSNALAQRLSGLSPSRTIVWPNRFPRDTDGVPIEVPGETERPYLTVEMVPVARSEPTLKGGGTRATGRGYMQVMVVAALDGFAVPAQQIIDAVIALFPSALRLSVAGGGTVTMIGRFDLVPGYRDGPDWRQGVRIYYEARR